MTKIPKFKPETVDGRIQKASKGLHRHLGLDDKKKEHEAMRLLLRKTHTYTACYNVDDYMEKYAGTDYFHSQSIDINMGDRAEHLGTEVAREIAKLSTKPMIPGIIQSDYQDQLKDAESEHGPLFRAYIWKEDPKKNEKIQAAIAIAEAQGANKIEQYRVLAKDCVCHACKNSKSLTGYLYKDIPESYFPSHDSGIDIYETGFSKKNNIDTLLDSCIEVEQDARRTEHALSIVESLIQKHKLGDF